MLFRKLSINRIHILILNITIFLLLLNLLIPFVSCNDEGFNKIRSKKYTLRITLYDESGYTPSSTDGTNPLYNVSISIFKYDNFITSGITNKTGVVEFNLNSGSYTICVNPGKAYLGDTTDSIEIGKIHENIYLGSSNKNVDLYAFHSLYHIYDSSDKDNCPLKLDYLDMDKVTNDVQKKISKKPNEQFSISVSFFEKSTKSNVNWNVSIYLDYQNTLLKNIISGKSSSTSDSQYQYDIPITAPSKEGTYYIRLLGSLDGQWPSSFYTGLHDCKAISKDIKIGIISKTLNGDYGVGELRVSSGPPPIEDEFKILSFELIKDDTSTNIIYSKCGPYEFLINTINTNSIEDFDYVELTLDPKGAKIVLLWNLSKGNFFEISDPNDYIELGEGCEYWSDKADEWTFNFNLIFNWSYPDEDFHNIQIYAASKTFPNQWYNISNIYRVENDIEFNGTLKVRNNNYERIEQNDFVKGGAKTHWSGLKVCYEGTTNFTPKSENLKITIKDSHNNQYTAQPDYYGNIYFTIEVTQISDYDGNKYYLNLTGIPSQCIKSSRSFILKIDSSEPKVLNPFPNPNLWQNTNKIPVGISISDVGSGVDKDSIYYSYSQDGGSIWSNKIKVHNFQYSETLNAWDYVTLEDGSDNLIKWYVKDNVGNSLDGSEQYKVMVDAEGVEFYSQFPFVDKEFTNSTQTVGITISDKYSGVDASTIEYCVSYDNGSKWSTWDSVDHLNDGFDIEIRKELTFLGEKNKIKWRAKDIAGNGPSESKPYEIIIRPSTISKVLEINILSPSKEEAITESFVILKWDITNKIYDNFTYDVILDTVFPPKKVILIDSTAKQYNATLDINNARYYWKVITNYSYIIPQMESEVHWFDVNFPIKVIPFNISIDGPREIEADAERITRINITITNNCEINDTIEINDESVDLKEYYRILDFQKEYSVESNEEIKLTIEILPLEDFHAGIYTISIYAISIGSEGELIVQHDINVIILEVVNIRLECDSSFNCSRFGKTKMPISIINEGNCDVELTLEIRNAYFLDKYIKFNDSKVYIRKGEVVQRQLIFNSFLLPITGDHNFEIAVMSDDNQNDIYCDRNVNISILRGEDTGSILEDITVGNIIIVTIYIAIFCGFAILIIVVVITILKYYNIKDIRQDYDRKYQKVQEDLKQEKRDKKRVEKELKKARGDLEKAEILKKRIKKIEWHMGKLVYDFNNFTRDLNDKIKQDKKIIKFINKNVTNIKRYFAKITKIVTKA